jgi:serine/threonine protein phosphatase PrpC
MANRTPAPSTDNISGELTVQAESYSPQRGPFIDDRPTQRIVPPKDGFRALPEGALLGNETYYVTSIRSEGHDCNVYGIEETRPIFPCPNLKCGYLENPTGKQNCVACDTPLNGVMPIHRRHQLHEYRDSSEVATAAHIAKLDLKHPGLLLYHYFVERPYGDKDRYYMVLPDPMPMLASNVTLPQKVARVLDWGKQLADALAYLHTHNIGWQQNAVLYLATGSNNTQLSRANLPEAAGNVFERVLDTYEITTAEALAEAFGEAMTAIRRPTTLRLRVGRHTDVGMVRDLNEDSVLTLELDRVHRSISRPIGLYVVADGMGGHAAGDVASGLAMNTIAEKMATHLLVPQLSSDIDTESFDAQLWLADAVQAANSAVYTHRQLTGTNMGTTLVAALLIGDTAHIANVGDSRAYLIANNDSIRQITTDHSLVERLVALGQISPDEARIHPQRNVIYRTVGDKEEAEIDFFVEKLNPGDSLLLCSDGLSGKVEDAEIWRLVNRARSPQEACEQLVQAANDNGGDDNITVIIVQASA